MRLCVSTPLDAKPTVEKGTPEIRSRLSIQTRKTLGALEDSSSPY